MRNIFQRVESQLDPEEQLEKTRTASISCLEEGEKRAWLDVNVISSLHEGEEKYVDYKGPKTEPDFK